jgi:hypothetical protein
MQAAQTRKDDDLAELGRLYGAVVRRVLAQGQVHSVLVVPVAELAEQALGVPLVQHDHVIEALAAKGADQPFGEGVHPRRPQGGADLADTKALDPLRAEAFP